MVVWRLVLPHWVSSFAVLFFGHCFCMSYTHYHDGISMKERMEISYEQASPGMLRYMRDEGIGLLWRGVVDDTF